MLRFKDIFKKLFFYSANQKGTEFSISRLVIELAAHLGH